MDIGDEYPFDMAVLLKLAVCCCCGCCWVTGDGLSGGATEPGILPGLGDDSQSSELADWFGDELAKILTGTLAS